jgi:Protein of unknown function (DUF1572)
MSDHILQNFLDESISSFRSYKDLAEKAMAQISDEEFFKVIDAEANSIAAITKHIGGNLRSRWSNFLTTDGEKPDRNRDAEFIVETDTRESVMQVWEDGFRILHESLESLTVEDLGKTVQIRGEDFTVVKAVTRALTHTASHIGQIQFLAKHFRGGEWQTLSIPKNKSAEFNQYLSERDEKGNYLEAAQGFPEKDLK